MRDLPTSSLESLNDRLIGTLRTGPELMAFAPCHTLTLLPAKLGPCASVTLSRVGPISKHHSSVIVAASRQTPTASIAACSSTRTYHSHAPHDNAEDAGLEFLRYKSLVERFLDFRSARGRGRQ